MKLRRSSNSSWRSSTFVRRNSKRCARRATNVPGLCTGCCERYRMARKNLDARTDQLTAYGLRLTACDLRLATYGWLLLGQAMQGAQPPHQIHCVNPDHRPVAEQLGEQPKRSAVVRIGERGHENRAIGDVEIGVTRRKPLAVEVERRGQRQGDDLDLRAGADPHPYER